MDAETEMTDRNVAAASLAARRDTKRSITP